MKNRNIFLLLSGLFGSTGLHWFYVDKPKRGVSVFVVAWILITLFVIAQHSLFLFLIPLFGFCEFVMNAGMSKDSFDEIFNEKKSIGKYAFDVKIRELNELKNGISKEQFDFEKNKIDSLYKEKDFSEHQKALQELHLRKKKDRIGGFDYNNQVYKLRLLNENSQDEKYQDKQ